MKIIKNPLFWSGTKNQVSSLLANWLQVESRKSRKQKRSSKQLYQDLLPLGFEGSYDRVAAFARRWRQSQHELAKTAGKGVYIPLSFAPGEAFQFDWSEDWAAIALRALVARCTSCPFEFNALSALFSKLA